MIQELDSEVIDGVKGIVATEPLVDEDFLDGLRKRKFDVIRDSVVMADLFVHCYSVLRFLALKLNSDGNSDYCDKLNSFLDCYGGSADYLMGLIGSYNYGGSVGDYAIKMRIDNNVIEKRKEYAKLLDSFFIIFGSD